MAVLHRDDGVYFALRPYRELLGFKKTSLFKKELELLARSHGHYVRLFPQPRGGYEAVFSRESGYLLGESVWQYLDKPNYLIYCEELPDKQEVLIVVVREGAIYLDAQISVSELRDELESLAMADERFEIYVYGKVPLAETPQDVGVFFPTEHVASFTRLSASLFAALPANVALQLIPYQRVIEELAPSRPYMVWTVGGIVLLAGIGWFMSSSTVKEEAPYEVVDPLVQYRAAFLGPAPSVQLSGLASQVELLYGLPGWVAAAINYLPSGVSVTVNSMGGTTGMLLAWSKQHNVQATIDSQGAMLTMNTPMASARAEIPAVIPMQLVLSGIIDSMMAILPGKSITIGTVNSDGGYRKTSVTIQLNGIAPYVLSLIGTALDKLPIILTNCVLTFKDGLLSGTIELSALGS